MHGSSAEGYLERVDTLDSRQFLVAIRRLADSLSYGMDYSRFLGPGIEFAQSRAYVWGDPVRSIDWRVTARTARVHVKEFDAPKRVPCWLLLDTSSSMAIASAGKSKYALALQLAGGLALACLDRLSPVGLLGVGERELRFEPSLGKDQVLQAMLRLRRFRWDEATALGRRVSELQPRLRHRALVIVLSDLHDVRAVDALKLLAQAHDCIVLQLQDPAESSLRGAGFVRAREAETGKAFVTHGRRRWLDQEQLEARLRRAGIDHLLVRTDRPFVHRLRHFLRARGVLQRAR